MPPLRGARGLLLLLAVSPSGGKTLKGGWIQINAGDTTCNPLDYGAVGDGKHDDTAGVQAAINACITSSGTALLPAGNIFLSWGLTITNAKNFILEVDGVLRFNNDTKNWKGRLLYCDVRVLVRGYHWQWNSRWGRGSVVSRPERIPSGSISHERRNGSADSRCDIHSIAQSLLATIHEEL